MLRENLAVETTLVLAMRARAESAYDFDIPKRRQGLAEAGWWLRMAEAHTNHHYAAMCRETADRTAQQAFADLPLIALMTKED